MAQATVVIANGAGAVVRAALNSSNEGIVTKQSGGSAPSPTYPFMEWADTASDQLKQRNAANSAWIIKGTLSAEYGGLPASGISYDPGSPARLEATSVQEAIDELADDIDELADIVTGALVPIERKSGGVAVASLDFTTGITTTYNQFKLIGWMRPATGDVQLWMRTDAHGGASFDAGASDYGHASLGRANATTAASNSAGDTKIQITPDGGANLSVGAGAAEGINFEITIYNNGNVITGAQAIAPMVEAKGFYVGNGGATFATFTGGGRRNATDLLDAFQLLFEIGNVSAYDVTLYGVKRS